MAASTKMRNPVQQFPEWRKTTPVLVNVQMAREAERLISSCEACTPDLAEIPFDYVLDSLTGCDPESTDYVLEEPAQCLACGAILQTGYWRWSDSGENGRMAFILPGTLIVLKKN
jgi:hypothetical protein